MNFDISLWWFKFSFSDCNWCLFQVARKVLNCRSFQEIPLLFVLKKSFFVSFDNSSKLDLANCGTLENQKSSEMWYSEATGENIKGWKQNPSWKSFCLLFKHLFEIRSQESRVPTVDSAKTTASTNKNQTWWLIKKCKRKDRENRLRLKGRNYFEDIFGF